MPKRLVNTKQSPRKPQSIDAHVGNQLKARRMMAVMSQIGLGKVAGITFQQVQKYERGATGSRLATSTSSRKLLQDFMGHRDPRHTSRYTRTASRRFEGLWK
jgi:DNA-binding XRE family transcriptional regulator